LTVRVAFFLEEHAEGVAAARVDVKIQIVAEDLRHAHGQLGGFAGLGDGIEKRVVERAADRDHFRARGDLDRRCGKAPLLRPNLEHAVGIDAVVDFPQLPFDGAADGERVSGAQLTQVKACWAAEVASAASCCVRPSFSRATAKFSPARTR
jgi:hypothetical protein